MTSQWLEGDLERDEGCERISYLDTRGNWTIGIGHLLGPDPKWKGLIWSMENVDAQFQVDLGKVEAELDEALPWWTSLDDLRQDVLVNMGFNMGVGTVGPPAEGLLQFHNTLGAIKDGDYDSAADNMLESKWAKEVGERAKRLAEQMRTGVHQT